MIGFDCEWVTRKGSVSPVSMIQIASVSGLCVLVRLCHLTNIPTSLKLLLANQEIFKLGVAITEDKEKLLRDFGMDVNSCVDIRHLVVRTGSVDHQGRLGLKSLTELLLGVSLDKDWRIRASDWELDTLTERQLHYAANDALAGLNITWVLMKKHFTTAWSDWFNSVFWSQTQVVQRITQLLELYSDLKFSDSQVKTALKSANKNRGGRKSESPGKKVYQNSTRKAPLYHNCLLEAPDGQVLCTMDVKKANWYINKDIGWKVSDDPLTVRLKFEPSGRPSGKSGEYYTSAKTNQCVVCGHEKSFLRKSVVPHEYRKYFPAVMKDHQSHDVLLMCVSCHQRSNLYDAEVRKYLSDLCSAPIGTEEDVKVRANVDLKKVKSAGRALINRDKIPDWRIVELENIVKDHYNVEELTEEIIKQAADCNFNEVNEEYVPHSRAVVQYFLENGGLLQLEVLWRKHFIDKMNPQYLPELWSVNHQEERLAVKAAENRIDRDQYQLATTGCSSGLDLEDCRNTKHAQLGINPHLQHDEENNRDEEDDEENNNDEDDD